MKPYWFLLIISAFSLAGCVSPQVFTTGPGEPTDGRCLQNHYTWNQRSVGAKAPIDEGLLADPTIHCAVSTHQIELPPPADKSTEGKGAIGPVGWRKHVLEFAADGHPDNEPVLVKRELDLVNRLQHNRPKFLVFYVHGWRNDASDQAEDPLRFNTLMAYTALHLEERCEFLGMKANKTNSAPPVPGTICGGQGDLVGIYIGWPGRLAHEFGPDDFRKFYAAATFPFIKSRSEKLARPVLDTVERIIAKSKQQSGGRTQSIVWGHSLGANLLLTGLTEPQAGGCEDTGRGKAVCPSRIESSLIAWERAVNSGQTDATLTLPGPDQYVLMNPATDARKWLEVQRLEQVVRERNSTQINKIGSLFSKQQPPRLMLSQVICEGLVDPAAKKDQGYEQKVKVACDSATFKYFKWSQTAVNQSFDPAIITAAGHFAASGQELPPSFGLKKLRANKVQGETIIYGPTHSLTNYTGSQAEPDLARSDLANLLMRGKPHQCQRSGSWLYKARSPNKSSWDTEGLALIGRNDALQVIYGFASTPQERLDWGLKTDESVSIAIASDRNTPFWNMRTDPSVVDNHGGFYSKRLFCHFNQLWLDSPALPR